LQTGQRIGSAIGTAALASVFYTALTASGHHYATAIYASLLCACGFTLLALLLAIAELVHRSRPEPQWPTPRPEHHMHRA
jgi:hypothetical protein